MARSPAAEIRIIHGSDSFRVEEAVRDALGPLDPTLGDLNRSVLEGEKLVPGDLQSQLEAMPFLAERRDVRVVGLLGRFEGDMRAKAKQELMAQFAGLVAATPPFIRLVLQEGRISASARGKEKVNPLFEALRSAGVAAKAVPDLRGPAAVEWVLARAAARGVRLGAGAAAELVERTSPLAAGERVPRFESRLAANELDKLAVYASGREIAPRDVADLVHASESANRWRLFEGIVEGRADLRELQLLLDDGESPFAMFAGLAIHLRRMWLLEDALARGVSPDGAAREAGLAWDRDRSPADLASAALSRPPGYFAAVHARLTALDQQCKTGRIEPRVGLELFAAELAGPGRGRA